jgi:surface-anchored protein/LPXTG-motif cell wall-anchored protein
VTITRPGRLAAALLAAAAVAVPGTAAAAPSGTDKANVDGADLMSFAADGGDLAVTFREAGARSGVDPAAVRLGPGGGVAGVVPSDPAFAFLGRPGTPVWSVTAGGAHFPALDATRARTAVTLRLASVDGPGSFAAYTLSRWGRPTVLLDSDGRTSTRLPAGRRLENLAWTFDRPGGYRLTFEAGAGPARDTAVYRVDVPAISPAAPRAALPAPQPPSRATAQRLAAPQAQAQTRSTAPEPERKAERKVIADGHVDMGPNLQGSTWTVRLKDDTTSPPVWRELSDVVLKVSDRAKIKVPAGAGYTFLGTAGDTVWLLPQSEQDGIVWPGWNTQHESVVKGTRGTITWRLNGVTGPGQFKLFRTGSFGTPEVLFDSAKSMPQQLTIPANTHAHGNWAFTRPGLYRLAVQMNGTTTAGKAVSDTRTLTLAVGDGTDPAPGFTDGAGTGSNAGTGAAADADTAGGAGRGKLAKTGADVISVVGAGGALLVAGLGLLAAARRRRH